MLLSVENTVETLKLLKQISPLVLLFKNGIIVPMITMSVLFIRFCITLADSLV